MPLTMLVAQHYIPILEIKDPGDHGPLILQPMFVGTFEQFVVIWAWQLFPFPYFSQLISFSAIDKTAADEALSSFCLFVWLEAWSFHFSKNCHKFCQPFPCHKCSPQNMPVLPKHQTLPEFWHCWSCICIPLAATSTVLHSPSMFTTPLPWQYWQVKQRYRQICMFEFFPFVKWDFTN